MPSPFSLVDQAQTVELLAPAADAAGRTSVYVTMKSAHKAFIVCHLTQGNAAVVALNLLQAQDVAGTGSKAGPAVRIAADLDAAAGDAFTQETPANTFSTDAALKNKIVIFEVPAEALDLANGFRTIAIETGASNAANITAAIAILTPERYAGDSPPSALVD